MSRWLSSTRAPRGVASMASGERSRSTVTGSSTLTHVPGVVPAVTTVQPRRADDDAGDAVRTGGAGRARSAVPPARPGAGAAGGGPAAPGAGRSRRSRRQVQRRARVGDVAHAAEAALDGRGPEQQVRLLAAVPREVRDSGAGGAAGW